MIFDIQGAFENVTPESVILGLRDKGASDELNDWCKSYLRTRSMTLDYQAVIVEEHLTLVTPNVCVLSLTIWTLRFKRLLKLNESGPVKDLLTMQGLSIQARTQWRSKRRCKKQWTKLLQGESGLTFSSAKTVAVLFTIKSSLFDHHDEFLIQMRSDIQD